MIVLPPNGTVNKLILDRAMLFAGEGEADMHLPWLDTSGVYAVPEENFGDERVSGAVDRLRRACAVYPDSTWCSAFTFGRTRDISIPLVLTDPAADFDDHVASDGSRSSLYHHYAGSSFLLFSMEYPAAVLFLVFDFILVTGLKSL